MAMDLVNSDVRFDLSQLSRGERFQLLSVCGEQNEEYSNFLHNTLRESFKEFDNNDDKDFYHNHMNGDDNFVNLVDESENEILNGDNHFLSLVEKSENGDDQFLSLVKKSENDVLNGDDHFLSLVEKSENEVLNGHNEVLDDDDDDDDPLYKLFLANVKGNGKSFTFEMKDENGLCKTIEYDKEVHGRHYHKDNAEGDICEIFETPISNDIKEKLISILRKPFDEQEYNTLWQEVTQKRYKMRHRELQDGREKSVRTKIKAKSYLQRHKSFRRAIKAVSEDKFRRLNILRGFAFWLQYLPGEGTFKPWEDASCLAIMPGSH